MKEKQKLEYIDNEEKEIVESLKDIDVNSIANDAEHIKQLEKSAKDYIAKQDKTITLRISSYDLNKLKAISAKKGLRYQTFIKSIIHQNISDYTDTA